MPDLSEEEIFESLKKTIESEGFVKIREDILKMITNREVDKAFALVGATQQAMMRAMTGILFNPFYYQISLALDQETNELVILNIQSNPDPYYLFALNK